MQKPIKKIRKINNLPNLSSSEQTHFQLKQYPQSQQVNDQSTLNASNDHHYEQAINEIKPNKTPYGFQQAPTQSANSNLKQSINTENRGNGSNNSQRYAGQQFHQPMYTSSKQSPSQIQTSLQNNNNSVVFRKATSNGSNKPQQQNHVNIQQNNTSINNLKNNQGTGHEQIQIIGGYQTTNGKQSTVPSRQNSGGPIKQVQQQQTTSNAAVKLITGQIVPPGSTQPRKVKQISTVNSTNVSPKNINDLLKFRVGQVQGHDQGLNQQNIQRQQINSINNQANNKIGMVNQSQILNQQANSAIFFQDGLRNRKQNIGTGNSDNYLQQNYQQINNQGTILHTNQQNEAYIRSSSDGKQPLASAQIISTKAQGLKDNSSTVIKLNTSGVYQSNLTHGHNNQQSPVMPGNGNSQVNYQPRKQLKKTVSNEGSAFMNSIGPQTNRPLQQNFITRPISSGQNDSLVNKGQSSYGGYVKLSNQSSQAQNNNSKFYSNIEAGRSNNSGSSATLGSYFQNNQGSNIHNQPQIQNNGQSQPNISSNQQFLGSQGTPISNDQLQEVIQKLIKNSKKHFHKNNQETEELTKYLRSILIQHLEKANGGNLPNQIRQDLLLGSNIFQSGSDQKFADNSAILNIQAITGNDPQGLNDLINELLKLNKPLISQQSQRAGSMGPVTNQKNKLGQSNKNVERCTSEKANQILESVNSQQNLNLQNAQYQNIQQSSSHQNNIIHQQQRILQQHPGHSGHSSSSIYNDSGIAIGNKHGANNPISQQLYGAQNPISNNISLNTSTSNVSIGNNGLGVSGVPIGVTQAPGGVLNNQKTIKHQFQGNQNIGQQNVQLSSSLGQKQKMKMQRPTINLSINNNVQNVIVTPLNNGQPQQIYPQQNVGPQINQGQGISNIQGQIGQHHNQQTSQMNQQQFNQVNQNLNLHSQVNSQVNGVNQSVQQSNISHQEQLILQAKQKRTSSEDNVNIQQQIKQGIQRTNANMAGPGQRVQTNQSNNQTGQWNQQIINYSQKGANNQPQSGQFNNNQRYLQNNQVYPQKIAPNGQQESPIIIKHRKNLPSLNNQPSSEQNSQANFSNSSHHKSGFNQSNVKFKAGAVSQNGSAGGSTTRGVSTDPAIPTAIQKKFVSNFTNGSGFLPGTRENSQNSGQNQKETHIQINNTQTPGSIASSAGAPTGAVNLVYSHGKQRLDSQGQSIEGSQGGINLNQVNTNSSQRAESKHSQNGDQNTRQNTNPGPPKIDDTILVERDQLIKYIKQYIKKNNELPPTTLNFYRFVKLIGKGAFGKVTLGVHKLTGKQVAIKTIEKNYMQDDFSKRKVFQEVYLLKKIKHSNVIRLLEVFESSKHLLMVMEYAGGGDLLRLIKRKGKLQESDAKFIFKQIAYGLAHIHCRSVIHRDIKLDNILLDCEKGVKICDFGVSKIIKKGQVIQEQCGTPAYLAPEIIIDKGYEGFFVDIWSLGVLLFAMLCGTVPFKASNLEDLHKLILKGEFTFPVELSPEAQGLVRGMIILEPKQRLTFPQILSHTWLKETNDDESEEEEDNQDEENGDKKVDNQAVSGGMPGGQTKPDIDLKNIQGNVNYVNVDNLFYVENYKVKLSYTDYCCITEDFSTENIDEEALQVCENFGFPRQFLIKCLNRGDINHATACYYLLTNAG